MQGAPGICKVSSEQRIDEGERERDQEREKRELTGGTLGQLDFRPLWRRHGGTGGLSFCVWVKMKVLPVAIGFHC